MDGLPKKLIAIFISRLNLFYTSKYLIKVGK